MKGFPYVIQIKKISKDEVDVKVRPQPIATKDEYIPVVAGKIQRMIMEFAGKANNGITRSKLKRELADALLDFHSQGMIRPSTKENLENEQESNS
jgi:hypothetical protein